MWLLFTILWVNKLQFAGVASLLLPCSSSQQQNIKHCSCRLHLTVHISKSKLIFVGWLSFDSLFDFITYFIFDIFTYLHFLMSNQLIFKVFIQSNWIHNTSLWTCLLTSFRTRDLQLYNQNKQMTVNHVAAHVNWQRFQM